MERLDILRWERREQVAWVWIDAPDASYNSLGSGFPAALEALCERLEADVEVAGVVILSAKPGSFVVGADLRMLETLEGAEATRALAAAAQAAVGKLAALRKPVVCAVHGSCLGGGLELALACTSRVATDAPETRLGLPEVQLGLLPGSGGTQRLPRLVGLATALDMVLTGRKLSARRAAAVQLIDVLAPAEGLREAASRQIRALIGGAQPPRPRPPYALRGLSARETQLARAWAESHVAPARALILKQARKQALAKSHGNYPAIPAIIEVMGRGLAKGMKEGLALEATRFGELLMTPESQALRALFEGQTALKKDSGVAPGTVAPPVARVGVLGAGLMGAGIAYVTAKQAGKAVRLKDRDDAAVLRGLASVRALLAKDRKRRRLSGPELELVQSRLQGAADYTAFDQLDVVIEAVFEDLAIKRSVLAEIEAVAKPELIFASNTSSLPIAQIAAEAKRPERVIGMHYFSPVEKMPLLEVITTAQTAPEVTAACVALGKAQGKTVIVVHDGPGFYTTRVLVPLLNEAARLLEEGAPVEAIDEAMVDFGFPVGPLKLTDEVGIDVASKVGKTAHEAFGERMTPSALIRTLLEQERLGRKSKLGFYDYREASKPVAKDLYALLDLKPQPGLFKASCIVERCVLAFVNECVRCFEEGILRSARDGDIGAVFGLGFPPYLGGPFRYADQLGAPALLEALEGLARSHGARFEPAPLIRRMAADGSRFFGDGDRVVQAPAVAA